jgi:hypothetical protein
MSRHRKQKACGKTRFRDLEEAKRVLRSIKTNGVVREKNPARAYECDGCHGAHLTSQA